VLYAQELTGRINRFTNESVVKKPEEWVYGIILGMANK